MQQLVFIIIFNILLGQFGNAQNHVRFKMVLPVKAGISLLHATNIQPLHQPLSKTVYTTEAVNISFLHLNDMPVLKLTKKNRKSSLIFTDLSFSDLLVNSMNSLKANLINTYDGDVPEMFNDAPSLFKVKCVIPL